MITGILRLNFDFFMAIFLRLIYRKSPVNLYFIVVRIFGRRSFPVIFL